MSKIHINRSKLSFKQKDRDKEKIHFKTGVYLASIIVGIVIMLFIIQQFFSSNFCPGIQPGELQGIWGILLYPFFHGSPTHLLSNAPPLFFLIMGMYYYFPKKVLSAILSIWLLSGLVIWFFGRPGCHLGASGIIYGLAFFLGAIGFIKRQRNLGAFALIIVFLYGGMVWGVLPQQPGISWEGHAGGAVTGLLLAILWRKTTVYTSIYDRPDEPDEPEDENTAIANTTEKGTIINYHFTSENNT